MALTAAELAVQIRVGDTADEMAIVSRLLTTCQTTINHQVPNAPEEIRDEAVIRMAAYLYDQPHAGRGANFANAYRHSGAAALLLPWRIHRAGSIEDAIAATQSAIGSPGNPVTGIAVDGTSLDITFADSTEATLQLPEVGNPIEQAAISGSVLTFTFADSTTQNLQLPTVGNPVTDVGISGSTLTFTFADGTRDTVQLPAAGNPLTMAALSGSTLTFTSADGTSTRITLPSVGNPITGASVSGSVLTFTFADSTTSTINLPSSGGGGVTEARVTAIADAIVDRALPAYVATWARVIPNDPSNNRVYPPSDSLAADPINGYILGTINNGVTAWVPAPSGGGSTDGQSAEQVTAIANRLIGTHRSDVDAHHAPGTTATAVASAITNAVRAHTSDSVAHHTPRSISNIQSIARSLIATHTADHDAHHPPTVVPSSLRTDINSLTDRVGDLELADDILEPNYWVRDESARTFVLHIPGTSAELALGARTVSLTIRGLPPTSTTQTLVSGDTDYAFTFSALAAQNIRNNTTGATTITATVTYRSQVGVVATRNYLLRLVEEAPGGGGLDTEEVQDVAGDMWSEQSEVTYNDDTGKLAIAFPTPTTGTTDLIEREITSKTLSAGTLSRGGRGQAQIALPELMVPASELVGGEEYLILARFGLSVSTTFTGGTEAGNLFVYSGTPSPVAFLNFGTNSQFLTHTGQLQLRQFRYQLWTAPETPTDLTAEFQVSWQQYGTNDGPSRWGLFDTFLLMIPLSLLRSVGPRGPAGPPGAVSGFTVNDYGVLFASTTYEDLGQTVRFHSDYPRGTDMEHFVGTAMVTGYVTEPSGYTGNYEGPVSRADTAILRGLNNSFEVRFFPDAIYLYLDVFELSSRFRSGWELYLQRAGV